MKKIDIQTAGNLIGFLAIVILLFLASCSKKDIQPPKAKVTYFIRVGAVNPTDTVYSKIIKVP
jgi:hypothetical protein